MLLDPITIHQRRTISIEEEPQLVQKENEKNTKTSSTRRERTIAKRSRNGVRRHSSHSSGSSRSAGLRKVYGGNRRRVGVVLEGFTQEEERQLNAEVKVNRRRQRTVARVERLSNSSSTSSVNSELSAREKGQQRRRRSVERATEKEINNQMACLIQAVFRGYVGRTVAREQKLLKRLRDIKQKKDEELASITAYKQQQLELIDLQEGRAATQTLTQEEENWHSKSEDVTQLLLKVQAARETNTKLSTTIAELKKENKRLAIENTVSLTRASQEEIRMNRLEHCGIVAFNCARTYKSVFVTGRQLLRDFDSGYDRKGRIVEMMCLTKAEDDELLN